jgi:hypothetical protein
MKLSVRLSGLEEMDAALGRIADPAGLAPVIAAGAEDVARAAAQRLEEASHSAPDAGHTALVRSLMTEFSDNGLEASIATPSDHGWRLEFGSLDAPAQPWLEPALQEARPGILRRIAEWLARAR